MVDMACWTEECKWVEYFTEIMWTTFAPMCRGTGTPPSKQHSGYPERLQGKTGAFEYDASLFIKAACGYIRQPDGRHLAMSVGPSVLQSACDRAVASFGKPIVHETETDAERGRYEAKVEFWLDTMKVAKLEVKRLVNMDLPNVCGWTATM